MAGRDEPWTAPAWTRRRFLSVGAAVCACLGGGWATARGVGALEASEPTVDDFRAGLAGPRLTNSAGSRAAVQPEAVERVETSAPIVALSFDDGPDPRYTPKVLDLLEQHRARATFFLVGVNAVARPDLVARQRRAGHTIGNHTYDHADLELLAPASVRAEIERGSIALAGAGAGRPTLFRPPKGHTDDSVRVIADDDRYRTIFWDVCLEHHLHGRTIEEGVASALAAVRQGSVIVAHDGGHVLAPGHPVLDRSNTVRALPLLLEGLRAAGLGVVDVPTLLHHRRHHGAPRYF
jgi:peptidoglycan/xylan/chitin deacetylase (PgdA/CDA1 family)